MNVHLDVKVRGPFFDKKIQGEVEDAIIEEALEKFGARMERGGRGLGARRNIITRQRERLVLRVFTTHGGKAHWPRMKGTSWQRKNVAVVRAMAPFVLRRVAKRIVEALD